MVFCELLVYFCCDDHLGWVSSLGIILHLYTYSMIYRENIHQLIYIIIHAFIHTTTTLSLLSLIEHACHPMILITLSRIASIPITNTWSQWSKELEKSNARTIRSIMQPQDILFYEANNSHWLAIPRTTWSNICNGLFNEGFPFAIFRLIFSTDWYLIPMTQRTRRV